MGEKILIGTIKYTSFLFFLSFNVSAHYDDIDLNVLRVFDNEKIMNSPTTNTIYMHTKTHMHTNTEHK